ncbi:MAG: hypothetical protein ABIZ73_01775, partial [Gemmatimonadaceae bacterium]
MPLHRSAVHGLVLLYNSQCHFVLQGLRRLRRAVQSPRFIAGHKRFHSRIWAATPSTTHQTQHFSSISTTSR